MSAAVCAAGFALIAATAVVAPASAAPVGEYVALGDSAAAGPLIDPADGSSPGCIRSVNNYPHVVAARLGARLTDVTCSSAKSGDVVSGAQRTLTGASVPVQTSALSARTKLVTLTIGANDIGLFQIALSCANTPGSIPCSQKFRSGGSDQIAAKIAAQTPRWSAVLDRIHAAAPNARVAVVGYGTYIRPQSCAAQPIRPADAVYLQQSMNRMNDAWSRLTRTRGMTYIDITKVTTGHDVCAAPASAYYFGLVPSSVGVPLHPTALGMSVIGKHVAAQL